MKREITKYVAKCNVCQQVKMEHQKASGATTVTIDTRMEVRGYHYELHVWIAKRKRGNDAFFAHEDDRFN
jgi:hypothetical protein